MEEPRVGLDPGRTARRVAASTSDATSANALEVPGTTVSNGRTAEWDIPRNTRIGATSASRTWETKVPNRISNADLEREKDRTG